MITAHGEETPGYSLGHLSLADMVQCGASWQRQAAGKASLEEAAGSLVRQMYDCFHYGGQRSFVLVRLFVTRPCGELPDLVRERAARIMGDSDLDPAVKCLVLL